MLVFFACLAALILGYIFYGRFVAHVVGVDPTRTTPAIEYSDGVDFIPIPTWRVFLIQLLDIAGLGPIFGAIAGAMFGPIALLWIVIGCIFGGAVHDMMSGMMSIRHRGCNVPDIIGHDVGQVAKTIVLLFITLLLVLVGAVFVKAPAGLLSTLCQNPPDALASLFDSCSFLKNYNFWMITIFVYYFCATILPINKIIGKIYPVFGILLLFMTISMVVGMFHKGIPMLADIDFTKNTHPDHKPIWPALSIILSCGAISGFHSTQSPLMARCLKSEKQARLVFYGAMITEGIIALIWVTVGLSCYDSSAALAAVYNQPGGPAAVVNNTARQLLGPYGGLMAVLGVIALPISTGDTAFRSCRLVISDFLKLNQKRIPNRLLVAIPLFIAGAWLTFIDFGKIWQYFGWANQTLATMVLWAASIYLARRRKLYWITLIPALIMTSICTSYILIADFAFHAKYEHGVIGGHIAAIAILICFFAFLPAMRRHQDQVDTEQ